jgi:hypothetical protein
MVKCEHLLPEHRSHKLVDVVKLVEDCAKATQCHNAVLEEAKLAIYSGGWVCTCNASLSFSLVRSRRSYNMGPGNKDRKSCGDSAVLKGQRSQSS